MGDRPQTRAGADILRVALSFAALSEINGVRRKPHASVFKRPERFWSAFEDRALYYDAFWGENGTDVLLLGPPSLNLDEGLRQARFTAQPSGAVVKAEMFVSRSTMTTRLTDVPARSESIVVEAFNERFTLTIQPNLSARLKDARILFAINKNNRLDWVSTWADWHVRAHGADTVIVFDNGSTDYGPADIENILAAVPGLKSIAVIDLPHRFGARDSAVLSHHYWAHFLQITAFNLVLRRFGRQAFGLLNLDIDELAWSASGSIFEQTAATVLGTGRLRGQWVEPVPEADGKEQGHFCFRHSHKNVLKRIAAPKWALDPRRGWIDGLDVHPYWHRIYNAPAGANAFLPGAIMFHFKGINTNWKEHRRAQLAFDPRRHRRVEELDTMAKALRRR